MIYFNKKQKGKEREWERQPKFVNEYIVFFPIELCYKIILDWWLGQRAGRINFS